MADVDTANRILRERRRQIAEEGYDVSHDDGHDGGELLLASLAYICTPGEGIWPFDQPSFKPSSDPISNLVKAGALLAAEGDRLLRRRLAGLSVHGGLIVLSLDPEEKLRVVDGLLQVSDDLEQARHAQ